MPPIDNDTGTEGTRARVHPDCVVCSPDNPHGLQLVFAPAPDGGVQAEFACADRYVGYPGYVQGGIVAALLDGAMTNTLFARGQAALTAEMTVRYLEPLLIGRPALVQARLERAGTRLQVLTAEVVQEGRTKASARGKFIPHPGFKGAGGER